ncbi:electron transport complex subunit RsxC [Crenobacter cavernae]|uniref:Ion-translocating oxidoreductase complex subunit C n=1 Tax=Crenobacter cavernae TaxID=2290923 RepID=A0A345Y993_9NEIS|nr:electron transport complex subunit RsxC [Crenobacter cavernae]AXK40495.1 electron transport complex subunit RsxC [Crenobacter cavernae]
MRVLHAFHGGVHPPENKAQSTGTPIATAPIPPRLFVPMSQSLGNAALPCVKTGDEVLKGQKIGEADGRLSAAVHAPTSGKIVDIAPHAYAHPSGLAELCVVIEPDGLDAWGERKPLADWQALPAADVRAFLADMGVVGLGGAVFPTHLKLSAPSLDTLVINGAECEPFISCDDMLMRERAADVVAGITIVATLMRPKEILIGIEDNKPEAIAAMREACKGNHFEVVTVPTIYPSGGAKQLIRRLTGKEVPHGTRSTDMGVQCFNVATVYTVERAIEHGEPVTSRIVTLTGDVERPHNVEALIGTPMNFLIDYAGRRTGVSEVLMGGPMMGFALPDEDAGVTKASNCLIARSPALLPDRPPAMPCIRCGDCASACPAELQPMDLYWFAKAKNFGKAQEWKLFDCIECGACSYVCPSQIPLVDYYRFAKGEIWGAERDKKAADRARARHEFRQYRVERDKEEKAQRLAERAAAKDLAAPSSQSTLPADDAKAAAIRAAMERAANATSANVAAPTLSDDAKKAAIEAAMARAAARKAEKQAGETQRSANVTQPAAPAGMDDAKKAAIQAALERAAARKAEKQAADTQEQGSANRVKPAGPATMDDAKKAAIQVAMERAAARKAVREAQDAGQKDKNRR